MSSVAINKTEAVPKAEPVDMKLEVVLLGVSDVDRAKAFYENLGWRLDIDIAAGDFRGVQMTPYNSEASIIFGMRWLCMRSRSRPIVLFHGRAPMLQIRAGVTYKMVRTFGKANTRGFSRAENSRCVRGVPSSGNCLGCSS